MSTSELVWFKSSYSGTQGDDCIEIAIRPGTVHIRDSKDKDGPVLTIPADAWSDFLAFAARH